MGESDEHGTLTSPEPASGARARCADFAEGCALIIGASGGIGGGVALGFAEAGCAVALGYRSRQAEIEATVAALGARGVKASAHRLDVTVEGEVEAAIAAALAAHGRVHTLVWAAGPLVAQVTLAEVSAEQWRQAIEVETMGFFAAVRAVLPHMRTAGGGSIVHLGSAGDTAWPPRDGLSVAPKAANEALVRGIAREEGRHNVRANSVLVGVIEAGMFLELSRQGVFDAGWTQQVQKTLCLKRWARSRTSPRRCCSWHPRAPATSPASSSRSWAGTASEPLKSPAGLLRRGFMHANYRRPD